MGFGGVQVMRRSTGRLRLAGVTLWVTVGSSSTTLTHPVVSGTVRLTSTYGCDRTSQDGSGRAGLPSQGGDTGSNPVGTTSRASWPGLVRRLPGSDRDV